MSGYICILVSVSLAALLKVTQCQIFMIKNAQLQKCVHAADDSGRVSMAKCKVNSDHQYWTWEPGTRSVINVKSKRCLTVVRPRDLPSLKVEPCDGKKNQAWLCDSRGQLSIYGHGLYLSAKQGTKKVILARGSDKFSTWTTLVDSPICWEMVTTTTTAGTSQRSTLNAENVTAISHEEAEYRNSSATLGMAPIVIEATGTSRQPGETDTPETAHYDDVQSASSWERIYVFEENSTGWKTAMLILSPFTFLLGVAIVVLNVRVNRKRKLSALPGHTKPHHKLGTPFEKSPLTGQLDHADYPGPHASNSTLRHGEILIEWKDGTITPLYDQQGKEL